MLTSHHMIRRGFFVGEDKPQHVAAERVKEVADKLYDWGFRVEHEHLKL